MKRRIATMGRCRPYQGMDTDTTMARKTRSLFSSILERSSTLRMFSTSATHRSTWIASPIGLGAHPEESEQIVLLFTCNSALIA